MLYVYFLDVLFMESSFTFFCLQITSFFVTVVFLFTSSNQSFSIVFLDSNYSLDAGMYSLD